MRKKLSWSKSGNAELKPLKDFLMRFNASSFGGRTLKARLVETLLIDMGFHGEIAIWLSGNIAKDAVG